MVLRLRCLFMVVEDRYCFGSNIKIFMFGYLLKYWFTWLVAVISYLWIIQLFCACVCVISYAIMYAHASAHTHVPHSSRMTVCRNISTITNMSSDICDYFLCDMIDKYMSLIHWLYQDHHSFWELITYSQI